MTLEASYPSYEVDPNSRAKSGPLLLWTIIDMLAPATRSIVTVLTKQMTGLPDALARLQFDVPKFHAHIRTLLADFGKQGMLDAQMIPYMLQAYKLVPDMQFRHFAFHLENQYNSNMITLTAHDLLTRATTQYNNQNADSTLQDNYDAVAFGAVQSTTAKKTKSNKKKKQKATTESSGDTPSKQKKDDSWKKKNPKNLKTITHNERTYHWCPHHEMFTIHKPLECKLATPPTSNRLADALTTVAANDCGADFGDE